MVVPLTVRVADVDNGVEPNPIHVVLIQPEQSIVSDELAHFGAEIVKIEMVVSKNDIALYKNLKSMKGWWPLSLLGYKMMQ